MTFRNLMIVGIYLFFAISFGYFQFVKPTNKIIIHKFERKILNEYL